MTTVAQVRRALARGVRVDVAAALNVIGALVKNLSLAFLVPIVTARGVPGGQRDVARRRPLRLDSAPALRRA